MNERWNELRIKAGIARLEDERSLVVINKEGKIINPLIGLEKFAELIVEDCLIEIQRCTRRDGYSEHNLALYEAMSKIENKFGVE